MDNCIFCKIANGKISSEKIYENDNFFSIFDIKPVVSGHCLIISKKHFDTTLSLPNSLGQEFLDCVKKTAMKILDKENAEGFNLVGNNFKIAGQLVPHFHMHFIPRKEGDNVKIF